MNEKTDPGWAWEPYVPSSRAPWDLRKVGHLYRRAAFGATLDQLDQGVSLGPERLLARLLAGGEGLESFEKQTGELAASIGRINNGQQASAWWVYRMLNSPHPLKEKMTLFWHNHFATSNGKVNDASRMLGQYDLMYRHALGSFRALVQGMTSDAAMLVWLDGNRNRKGMPNENYARELMELFSLGIGNYSEKDIREAARAFTGWEVVGAGARYNAQAHDDGDKTVLGQKGNWDGAGIVRICLEQPACPRFLAGKLYRFLVSDVIPSPRLLEPLAERLRQTDFDIGGLVQTILRSNLFYAPESYRAQIKSPVSYVLGIVHALEGRPPNTQVALSLADLGQNVFYPPSVKGWDGGPAWLNGQTLLFRQNLALALTSTEDARFGRRTDPAALAHKHSAGTNERLIDFFLRLFLQGDVPPESRARLLRYVQESESKQFPAYWTEEDAREHRVRALCHLVLTLPEYQLN